MTQTYQLELNQENIDKASELVTSFLKNNKTESKEISVPEENTI